MKASDVPVNLTVLKPSRERPRVGDVFVVSPFERAYYFGRVVSLDAQWGEGPEHPAILVYLYDLRSDTKKLPKRDLLAPPKLLIAPQIINKLGWSRGYFETVGNLPIRPADLVAQHCFLDPVNQRFVDEFHQPLDRRFEPCGLAGLGNFNTIDQAMASALGLPGAD